MHGFRLRLWFVLVALLMFSRFQAGAAVKDIFSDTADAKADIRAALLQARHEHKRVLLDFGGNWCSDCHLLDYYLQQEPNATLLKENYVIVEVNIGHYDKNLDVAAKYNVPLKAGVPAVLVVTPADAVLNAMTVDAFEKMSRVDASAVTEFLNQWKPSGQGSTRAQ